MTMTITRGLKEITLLEKKIIKLIKKTNFVAYRKRSGKIEEHIEDKDFHNDTKAAYASIESLIDRKRIIKRKILESNAITKVKINDLQMTVADAIEFKESIKLEKELLKKFKERYQITVCRVEEENETMNERLDIILNQNFNKDNVKTVKIISEEFKNTNEHILIDPLNINEKINELDNFIDKFESEVDFVLSESNALMTIDIQDN